MLMMMSLCRRDTQDDKYDSLYHEDHGTEIDKILKHTMGHRVFTYEKKEILTRQGAELIYEPVFAKMKVSNDMSIHTREINAKITEKVVAVITRRERCIVILHEPCKQSQNHGFVGKISRG